ncbi:NAD(P)/FAD-dependent oxidoreductase [Cryptosporangium phraense]|uniref:FAD-binding protein n=1 Tax=Cryptosporangium phraense TaxID=2593070 RepID=A0A545AJF0_9ACTN|nr:FAD-dependent oxidoreductase [Cryptosporangium phraense]TQS41453.1 FAD-binding protein [Cryptosporangium phraense]
MAADVQIIGAGIAGLACARALASAGHQVVVRERADSIGGRLATRELGGRPVDLGASYLTCRDQAFRTVVDDWVRRGLAHPWTSAFTVHNELGFSTSEDGPVRYGTSRGLAALVEDLATGIPVRLGDPVAEVGPGPVVDGVEVDGVVLAMPDPEALALLDPACEAERAAVNSAWSPVIAVASAWPRRTWDVEGVFVHGDPVLDWIADDGRRRADSAPVLVAHSTAEFAAEHLDEVAKDAEEVVNRMVDAVRTILDIDEVPSWTFAQAWPHARPLAPRATPFFLGDGGISMCGDAWGSPRVENAWLSGHKLGLELARRLS